MTQEDRERMAVAMREAEKALEEGEIPVGAALFRGDTLLWADHNRREQAHDPTAHAELLCMRNGAAAKGDWRLNDCTLYVTLEPCPMCAGAIVQARIKRVVIGAMNPKAGCAGSIFNLLIEPRFNHRCEVETGMLEEESRTILQRFFGGLRKKAAEAKQKEAGLMKAENAPGCVISENMV
jgi:tRNA(adenine34) deaminase